MEKAKIYEIDRNKFLILIDENELSNMLGNSYVLVKVDKNLLQKAKELGIDIGSVLEERLRKILRTCGGRDLNPRTPTGGDLESPAFGLARQPPRL